MPKNKKIISIAVKDLQRVFATIIFATSYHALYVDYLHPIFGYMHYRLEHRDWFEWLFVYCVAVTPSIWQRGRNSAVACGISLIYLLLYVPALITMCAMWMTSFFEFVILALSLMIGQFVIQIAMPRKKQECLIEVNNKNYISTNIQMLLAIFTAFSLLVFIIENRAHMDLVGFADVYDLRFASRDVSSKFSGYLSMWLIGISLPFYLSFAVMRRSWFYLIVAILLSVIIYMGNGAKSALLMPVQAFIVGLLVTKKRNPTFFLSLSMGGIMWVLYVLNVEWLNLLKSLVIMRLLSTGGWMMTTYYEYFSINGWTYYSHVGPIGLIFGKIYTEELGRIIGFEYLHTEDANFNANFWATDGIAAFGPLGLIFISLLMAAILRFIYRLSVDFNQRAVAMLLTGLWLSILNGSLFTSMFSGGGLLLLVLLFFMRDRRHVNTLNRINVD